MMDKIKEKIKLYFDDKNKTYYYVDDCPICSECNEEIKDQIIIQDYWTKKQYGRKLYCMQCYRKIEDYGIVDEKKVAIVMKNIPDNAVPIFNQPPRLEQGKIKSTFHISDVRELSSRGNMKDRTRIAGRNYLQIDPKKIRARIEARDEVKNNYVTKEELKQQIEAKPIKDVVVKNDKKM